MQNEKLKINKYREAILKREKQEQIQNKKMQEKGLLDIERIKNYLIKETPVKEIYLFGSILNNFKRTSDIDIAVSGIPDKDFLRVYSILDDFTNFNVELIDLDERNDFFRENIRKMGKRIYEREN